MERPVFEALLEQLRGLDFDGRFSYHFYNEPLLRRDLEEFVRSAAARLPAAHQVLYTNGDLLTDARFEALAAAGIEEFIVTRHDGDSIPARPGQTVLVPADLALTSRGGTFATRREARALPCYAPVEMLIVTATGDVLLCYEDAHRDSRMGNILHEPLLDIWTSERFVGLRRQLSRGHRSEAGGICAACDNAAHADPGSSWFAL